MNNATADVLPLPPRRPPRAGQVKVRRISRKAARKAAVMALLSSALTWLFGCAFAGAVMITVGVFVLAGIGWTLIAVGVFLFVIAGLLRLGIVNG